MSSTMETMSSKDKVIRQSKLRCASQLGSSVKGSVKPKDTKEYVKCARSILDLQIATLLSQRAMLDELTKISDDEKMDTLFTLLDKVGDGWVDTTELADGLRKVHGDVGFEDSLVLSVDLIATYDKGGKAKLNKDDFATLMRDLSKTLGANFHELSELLVLAVVFEPGNTPWENKAATAMADDFTQAVKIEQANRKALVDSRMKALFQLFDANNDGAVDFQEVVLGLYRITQDLEGSSKAAMMALMLFDKDSSRDLNFDQFSRFIINVVAATPQHWTFDDIADALTLAASQDQPITKDELMTILNLEEIVQEVLDVKEEAKKHMDVDTSQLARAYNLFKMWDLNANGTIDIKELSLGLKKFEETNTMKMTITEAIEIMGAYDLNGDTQLDRNEFILFLVHFAKSGGVSLDEMLDFMIVKTCLVENSPEEVNYVKALTESDIYYWSV